MESPVLDQGRPVRPAGSAGQLEAQATLAPRPLGQLGPRPLDPGQLGPGPLLGPRPQVGPRPTLVVPSGGVAAQRAVRRRELVPNASLISRIDLTPSIARFTVRPDGGVPAFKPGQYFALGIEVDGAFLQRPYSTSSSAGSTEQLEFLVRRVGTGTFTPRLWDMAPGGRVWIGPPKGLFTLQPGDERTHLFLSTGTGLAPFVSMTAALMRSGDAAALAPDDGPATGSGAGFGNGPATRPRIAVVHGVSHVAELAYRDLFDAWSETGRLSYVPTISRPADPANAGWMGATGRTEAILDRAFDQLALDPCDTVAYVCGNPEMIEIATTKLRRFGLPESAVIRELYWTVAGPAG